MNVAFCNDLKWLLYSWDMPHQAYFAYTVSVFDCTDLSITDIRYEHKHKVIDQNLYSDCIVIFQLDSLFF